ncbi:trypsin-like serine peptidase [Rhodococcus spelaei]|uniref:trypsin-like serine peptidase n=1 Tax=Rhodococcus spelaei TaxID=2546320 RepID=UPI001FE7BCF5|nr:trypsin-like peptidase domain-containing protein [Rhodococcus spelaei]
MGFPTGVRVTGTVAAVLLAATVAAAGPPVASAGPAAHAADPDPRVGALFVANTPMHFCSGAVLDSAGGDLVVTAAHCLAGTGAGVSFVPGFDRGVSPFGEWAVTQVYLDPRWIATQDPRSDYAVLRVRRIDATSVAGVATVVGGGLPMTVAPAVGAGVTVTGYPTGDDRPVACTGGVTSTTGFPTLACDGLRGGTSGAPWVGPAGVGAVVGGLEQGGCTDSVSYSSEFGADALALVRRADGGEPGDVAPVALAGLCTGS